MICLEKRLTGRVAQWLAAYALKPKAPGSSQLLVMCRGELSALIARLMFKRL